MRLNRLLKYINITIALAVLVIALAVYWFAGRPLPQTSGTINAPVSQKVTVAFDALGEPHIDAANDNDLLFAQGYLTAAERLWQMEALRRLAGGDLSEVVGPGGLESDQEVRRLPR